jgi:hypothetical protein
MIQATVSSFLLVAAVGLLIVGAVLYVAEHPSEEAFQRLEKTAFGKVLKVTMIMGVLVACAGMRYEPLLWVGTILTEGALIIAIHLANEREG